MRGKVETVHGPIDPDALGSVLTHEHLSHTLDDRVFTVTHAHHHAYMKTSPIVLENMWWIRQFPYSHVDNLIFSDENTKAAVMEEMKFFKQNGGGTIVENSCRGMGRDIPFFRKISTETGVHVVAGTGYYVTANYSGHILSTPVEELTQEFVSDIIDGADGTTARCGIIGELGCTWPLQDFEKRVLRAAAAAQQATGCPVIIHPGRNPKAPFEIIRIFTEAGGRAGHTVMSHLDRTLLEETELAEFASLGCYCEHDLFGIETSHYQPGPASDMPSDAQRLRLLKYLVDQGYEDRIVVGHDIHTKHRLMKYGGHGYSHILLNIVPKMLERGFSLDVVHKITQTNPQTWLTFFQ
uniref:Putative resiniferatoxin-binding phosphotriesterase-related protein n=1 Tax=Ornithodoros turicata TaxID=34597 RepID=A0A2R5LM38_9ACAR